MNNNNLLFVTDQFATGGVESVFINIVNNIDKNVTLIPLHNNINNDLISSFPSNVKLLKSPVNWPRNIFGLAALLLSAFFLRLKFKPTKFTIINFSDTLTTLLFCFVLSKGDCISWIHCNPLALLKPKTHVLYWFLLSKCKKLIFLSKSQKQLFFSIKLSDKVSVSRSYVCTNFLNLSRISTLQKESIHVRKKFFLMVSRLDVRSKDFETLIRAYSLLPNKIQTNYNLLIAGQGPDKSKVVKLIHQYKLSNNVFLIGNQKNPYKYMRNCSLYIHSSVTEGFPMVLLEALACGCTIISSDCKVGPKEILGNGKYGYLYPERDYSKLESLIERGIDNPISPKVTKKRAIQLTETGKKELKELL